MSTTHPVPGWHKDNPALPGLIKNAEYGTGDVRADAVAQLQVIKQELEHFILDNLLSQPAFQNLSPELLRYLFKSLYHVAPVIPQGAGRPRANRIRNLALVRAVKVLAKAGHSIGDACDRVAAQLRTEAGVEGHHDNLSARRVQRIYQQRDKNNG